jgi:NAD(P)-dependent dehydrogenase (short-subunit alcohol dehydrogenase family)
MKLLLIGMGPGIGRSVAKRFGAEGFEILMVARQADRLAAIKAEFATLGIRATGYAVDLADDQAFQRTLQQIVAAHPDIDILHYNASAYNPALPSEIRMDVLLADLKVNIAGAVLAYQAVLPGMKAKGRGAVMLTGGGTAFQAPANLASLGIGKAGMRSLVFTLAEECAPLGIHVATITVYGMVKPGTPFDPDLIADRFWALYRQPEGEWETEVVWK